jgi:hypothetical protein
MNVEVVVGVRTTVVVGIREIVVVGVSEVTDSVPLPDREAEVVFPLPPISPSQTIVQDSELKFLGTWSQKRSVESRTKKPFGRERFPVLMRPERKSSACTLMENAWA